MNDIEMLEITMAATTLLVFFMKTAHYFITIRRKNLNNWFHFNYHSIVNSQNERTVKAKKIQNTLTSVLMFLLILTVAASIIIRFVE